MDATNMAKLDLNTGVQRVIRELGRDILRRPDLGRIAEMVHLDGQRLRHARAFAGAMLGLPDYGLEDHPVAGGPSDIVVLMDHHGELNEAEAADLRRLQRQGTQIVLLVHDILPLQYPDWFPSQALPALQHWFLETLGFVDRALCTSRSGMQALRAYLDGGKISRTRLLEIGFFPLGSDFVLPKEAGEPASASVLHALEQARQRPSMLLVGTVEPRKGHEQALAAFDALWSAGLDVGLTIVGKPGWMTGALVAALEAHREKGRRLNWLAKANDAELAQLYRGHAGLLMASKGEGFGLPLVEAAHFGLPILARDLPIFREIAGDGATFFSGEAPEALAEAVRRWLDAARAGRLPSSSAVRRVSWKESADALLAQLTAASWPVRWMPSAASDAAAGPGAGPDASDRAEKQVLLAAER